MWNVPNQKRLDAIPRLYATEKTPENEKEIHLHFFYGNWDWYVAEYDGEDTFFGYTVMNGDTANAEWGYISFSELKEITINGLEIDCELEEFWKIKPFGKIDLYASQRFEGSLHA